MIGPKRRLIDVEDWTYILLTVALGAAVCGYGVGVL